MRRSHTTLSPAGICGAQHIRAELADDCASHVSKKRVAQTCVKGHRWRGGRAPRRRPHHIKDPAAPGRVRGDVTATAHNQLAGADITHAPGWED
jgi:hypothetical protein